MMPLRGLLLRSICVIAFALTGAESSAAEPDSRAVQPSDQSVREALTAAATFFRNPTISRPKLSPDGKQIAFVYSADDSQRVFARSVVGTETIGLAEFPLDQSRLRWFDWVTSSRVLLSADVQASREITSRNRVTRIYSVNTTRPRLRWLGEDWRRGPDWPTTQSQFPDRVINLMRGDADNVLISHVEFGERTPSVSRMNVLSGRLRQIERARGGLEIWHADPSGIVRAAEVFGESADRKSYALLARSGRDQELAQVLSAPDHNALGYAFAGFHDSPGLLYVFGNHDGRRAVFELDVKAKKLGRRVFAHDQYDATALRFAPSDGKVVGVEYLADQPEIHFFDDAASKEQGSIDHSLAIDLGATTTNRVVSATRDGRLSIVEVTSDVQPPVYYALDRDAKTMNFVFDQRPGLPVDRLLPVEAIKIRARDGTAIPGYLTRPRGSARSDVASGRGERAKASAPMIVMLHPGFGARASRVYDPAVQFFASRGYAVLQVNHRGSGGYGRAFRLSDESEEAATKVALGDIADGLAWAIEAGVADPRRVAIFGVQGGGALAMLALANAPNSYRAGASYGGATGTQAPSVEIPGAGFDEADGAFATRNASDSPLAAHRLAESEAPLLLAHGGRNAADVVEAERNLASALAAAGKPIVSVEYPEETIGFALERNRSAFFEQMLAFFEEHLNTEAQAANPIGTSE